jgi:NAD(P)-dependent dehydrogenase (short-subunit alcohol dehydrogenase family)
VTELPEFSLEGQVVIVTGAGRGIGRGIACASAAAGALVIGCGRSEDDLATVEAEITASGGACHNVVADVTSIDDLRRVVATAVDAGGQLDGIVNNAGANIVRDAVDYTEAEVDYLIDVDYRAVYWSCVIAARQMMSQGGGGVIVNITSQAAMIGAPGRAPYAGLKAGVNNLTRTFAAEWASHSIRVNALAPGLTLTPLAQDAERAQPGFLADATARIPLGRAVTVREIGLPAVFLLSDAAAMITGHTLVVDGGRTA